MKKHTSIVIDNENTCLKQGVSKLWKFIHYQNYQYKTQILKNRSCDFEWFSISDNGTITLKVSHEKGYAWDGCSPKGNFLNITWGTPDGELTRFEGKDYKPYTYYASMIHDVLYQYKRCVPVTRKEVDVLFYQMLKEAGFMWAGFYYVAVRLFGGLYGTWKYTTKKEIEG